MNVLQVKLLGAVSAEVAGTTVRFLADKRYQLLSYLAYRGDWVSREELAHLFWAELPEKVARHSLRQLFKRVRKLNWLDGLEVDAQNALWDVETDLAAFERAIEMENWKVALAQYRGPLLDNLKGVASAEFEQWLEFERAQLHGRWRDAAMRAAEELVMQGQPAAAAALLTRLLDEDALDEEALTAYMGALAQAGQRERALRAYHTFADGLREETGLEPTVVSQELARAISVNEAEVESTARAEARQESPWNVRFRAPLTGFVGRDLELAEIAHLLARPDCRLLTLTGLGGAGKSAIARHAALEFAERYEEPPVLVPLDSLGAVRLIPTAIAGALGLTPSGNADPLTQVVRRIGEKRFLLILDDFERLVEGAPIASRLIEACPNLDLLVTSRERLRLVDEWLLPIDGLAFPQKDDASLADFRRYDAVQLFVQRARRVRPGLTIETEQLPHVVQICRLVQGFPLAIELAAVWLRYVPFADLVAQIRASLDFLVSNDRDQARKHQSMRATFDNSWMRLSTSEQTALRRLAVFRGGFDKDATRAVAGSSIAVLAALADKSLLRVLPGGRFGRHPLIHQYTLEKLAQNPEELAECRERHSRYYLALAEQAEPLLRGPQQAAWLERMESEHDNLRVALEWLLARKRTRLCLRLSASLGRFWLVHGHLDEGRDRLEQVLTNDGDAPRSIARAKALNSSGSLALAQGDHASARSRFEEAALISRELGDREGLAASVNNLGNVARLLGDYRGARSLHEESLAVRREMGHRWGVAYSLNNLGVIELDEGKHEQARNLFLQSLALIRALEDLVGEAMALNNLGLTAEKDGDYESARAYYEQSLAKARALGDRPGTARLLTNLGRVAAVRGEHDHARSLHEEGLNLRMELGNYVGAINSLEGFATLAALTGAAARATRLAGAVEALREANGISPKGRQPAKFDEVVALAHESLGEAGFRANWREGRAMSLHEAAGYALGGQP